ncbi:L-shaped tail fiber protein [Klebsiella phage Spivey]|nr:L-shaped tail fiber protein [Klebsiella phage Spivey]
MAIKTKIIVQQLLNIDDTITTASKYPKYTVVLANSISSITAGELTSAVEASAASAAAAKQSEINAKASENGAAISAAASQQSATQAASSATASANSAKAAKTSETNAKASEVAAKTSETNAKASETAAKTSETNAKASEVAAKTSETNAKASEVAAKTSETKSKTSETNAKASETAAKTSETNAKASEVAAKTSETNSKASEVAAKTSETKSNTSETNAKASETAAKTSETNAEVSEVAAKTSETNSKASEVAAKTSETNAKASENAAAASKNAAKTSQDAAKASETAALASKNAAAASETAAKTSENEAAASKNAAATSATSADSSKVAAAASAAAAKTSETNAKTSETNAKTSETNANNSKNAAATSETNAKTSETNAKTSETNAKTSETNAKEYADKASLIASPLTQYNWPVGTAAGEKYIKIAKLSDPGSSESHVTLMITNGGNYGARQGSIDFLDASARSLGTTVINASNVRQFMQIRRLGDPSLAEDNQLRYGIVKGDGFFEIWAFQRAFINNVKVAILAKAGWVDLYIPSGYVSQNDMPADWVESKAIRVYDELNKPSKEALGLGSAAYKDVGTSNDNVMQVGVFGLGGSGISYDNITSDADLLQRMREKGGHFWRASQKSGASSSIMSHGSGMSSRCGDTISAINIDYNSGKVVILAANDASLNAGNVKVNTLYGTVNKPSKSDVGLGNVTNDAQVKKVGDTMTGDLDIAKATPAIRLKSASGNAHVWFQNGDGGERGVLWSPPNNESLGEVRIRAKTTGGTTGGDFIVRHDGRIEARDAKISYKISSRTADFSNDDTDTGATSLRVSGKQHTPIMLTRDADSDLSIGFKLNNMSAKLLGIDVDGDLAYGENSNQAQNSKVVTRKMMDAGFSVAGPMTFANGFFGAWEAENIDGQTLDLNSLTINLSTPGTVRIYRCPGYGGGANITNKPSGVGGNFILYVESLRKVSDTDFTNRQRIFSSDLNREFTRYSNGGTWSAWRESVVSGTNQDVSVKTLSASGSLSGSELAISGASSLNGNLGVGGGAASKVPGSDKGIVMGRGAMVREGGEGRLILSASGGTDRQIQLRPAGAAASDNGIEVSCTAASGGDTKIAFGQGAAIRCNSGGEPIISAKAGQRIYLRPNGDGSGSGQVTIDGSGNMVVNGGVNSKGIDVTASQSLPLKETTATTGVGVNFIGDNATECSFGIENTAGGSAVFHNYARGASNSVTKNNQLLGGYGSRPWLGSDYTEHSNAALHFLGAGDTSGTNHGGWIRLLVTPKGKTISDRVPAFRLSDNGDLWLVPDGAMHSDLGLVRSFETLNAVVPKFNAPTNQDGRGLKLVSSDGAPEINMIAPRGSATSSPAVRAMWCDGSLGNSDKYIGATQSWSSFFFGASGHDGEKFDSMRGAVNIQAAGGWGTSSTPTRILFETCTVGSTARTARWSVDHNGNFVPMGDGSYDIGWGSGRVKNIYATNGSINTSDARLKNDVRMMSNPETEAAKAIAKEIGFWTWKEQADMNDIREHCGLTVQRAMEIMESFGLEPFKYGFICHDEWDEQTVVSEYGSLNEDGTENPIYKTIPAGDRYSFRLDELNMFIAKGFEARLSEIEEKLGM